MAGNFLKYGASRGDVREQERRRHPRRRAPADRAVRAAADVHQLRRAREGRREVARSAGQLHGRRSARSPRSACSAPRTSGRSDDYTTEKMPAGERRHARRPARVAPARWRPHRSARTGSTSSRGPTRCSAVRRRPRRHRRPDRPSSLRTMHRRSPVWPTLVPGRHTGHECLRRQRHAGRDTDTADRHDVRDQRGPIWTRCSG